MGDNPAEERKVAVMKAVTVKIEKPIYDYIICKATLSKKSVQEVISTLLRKGYELETYWEE